MEELSKTILSEGIMLAPVSIMDIVLSLAAATVLNGVLAKLYMITHGGYSYSKTFLHSIVLVGLTVSLIMVIIGSDIARAFALVGAMSIVRFRTPVKDTRDLVFLFAAIAVGMACGTQFYEFAAVFVVFMAAILLVFHFSRFGDVPTKGYVLKMRMNVMDRDAISELCGQMCERFSIVSISRINGDENFEDIIYEVQLKRGFKYDDLVEKLSTSITPLSINMLVGEGVVNA